MKGVRFFSLRRRVLRLARWAILLFPITLTGCFDSQSASNRLGQRRAGISFLNRYFSSGQALSEKASEDGSAADFTAYLRARASGNWDISRDLEGIDIALPDFLGSERYPSGNMLKSGNLPSAVSSRASRARNSSFNTTAQLFNKSFAQFFSSVFNQDTGADISQLLRDEIVNPFTEAKQKREMTSQDSAAPVNKTDAAEDSVSSEKETAEKPKQESKQAPATPTTPPIPAVRADQPFLIIGDFDGSGVLRVLTAGRSGDTAFVSDDGERGFNLYINPGAVEQERSFYVDDINSDGITDLLVTSRTSLFGGVLLGDGYGGYRVYDKFLTEYEPIIPGAGPSRDGKLEILALDARTGTLSSFVSSDRYRKVQSQNLSFLPDYLLHLVAPGTSRDFLMAAQVGGIEQILGWGDDNLLRPTSDVLGADAKVLNGSFGSASVQAYKAGSYASLVLGNGGKSFNVANLRLLPRTFIVLGDFYSQGSLDVAVGNLLSFTPKK